MGSHCFLRELGFGSLEDNWPFWGEAGLEPQVAALELLSGELDDWLPSINTTCPGDLPVLPWPSLVVPLPSVEGDRMSLGFTGLPHILLTLCSGLQVQCGLMFLSLCLPYLDGCIPSVSVDKIYLFTSKLLLSGWFITATQEKLIQYCCCLTAVGPRLSVISPLSGIDKVLL